MNLIETLKEHRKMWEWIARNIMVIKPDSLTDMKRIYFTCVAKQPLGLVNMCYLCTYFTDCDKCVLDDCFESNSLYNRIVKHIMEGDYKKASNLSHNMAMLPINEVILKEYINVKEYIKNDFLLIEKLEQQLTKEKAILEHRKMWNWIADNVIQLKPPTSTNIKKLYLQSCNINVDLMCNDFMCEYVHNNYKGDCHFCPIRWGASYFSICGEEEQGIFQYCLDNMLYKDASYIAKVIAQLPTKE